MKKESEFCFKGIWDSSRRNWYSHKHNRALLEQLLDVILHLACVICQNKTMKAVKFKIKTVHRAALWQDAMWIWDTGECIVKSSILRTISVIWTYSLNYGSNDSWWWSHTQKHTSCPSRVSQCHPLLLTYTWKKWRRKHPSTSMVRHWLIGSGIWLIPE